MQFIRIVLSALLIGSLSIGCSYVPTRSLAYDPIPVAAPTHPTRVLAVRILREDRPPRSYPNLFGSLFLTYLPLLPYVTVAYERLDESDEVHKRSRGFDWNDESAMTHLLMRAVAKDLASSGFFSQVRLLGDGPVPEDVDYVLAGSLESTAFNVYTTSYGLGMAGVLLWFLPIPIGKQEGNVEIGLSLSDRSGREVWSERLSGEGSRIYTLYNSGGAAISSRYSLEIKRYGRNKEGIDGDSLWAYYASAVRAGMVDIKTSLASFLAKDEMSTDLKPASRAGRK